MTARTEVELYEGLELERQLMAAVERANKDGRHYAVIACVPQRFRGEDISDVVATVAQYATELVSPEDIVGLLDAEVIVVGLEDANAVDARVFAYQLQGDLRLHSQHMRNTVWDTGYSCLPDSADSSQELLLEAVESAIMRRRRLGS